MYRYLLILSIVVFLFLARIISFFMLQPSWKDGEFIQSSTVLLSDLYVGRFYKSFNIRCCSIYHNREVQVRIPQTSKLHYGQLVFVSGNISIKNIKGRQLYTLTSPELRVKKDQVNAFTLAAFHIRYYLEHFYDSILPPDDSALLLGIMTGIKGDFSQDFISNLRSTGLMHVIAASGMNISILSSYCLSFLGRLVTRKKSLVMMIAITLFYMLLSGFQSSIVRASIMSLFAFGAGLLGKQYTSWYVLLITVVIMIFFDPLICFSIGFQLSVFSTIGILLGTSIIKTQSSFLTDVLTTTTAQIMTTPLLLFYFGQYGVLSILANSLVLWTIPFIMVIAGLASLVGVFLAGLGKIILLFCFPLLILFRYIVTVVGSLNVNLTLESLPIGIVMGYYALILGLISLKKELRSS